MPELETLHEGKFLRLVKRGRWEYVQRVGALGSVHILAVTPENELLLVEQYRAPVDARVIELPAGIVGDEAGYEDETIEQAATRELEEETGYRPARIERLFRGPAAPGMASEMNTLVRAFELQQVGAGGGIDNEDITVIRVPLAKVSAWLAAVTADGRLTDHRVYAALQFMRAPE